MPYKHANVVNAKSAYSRRFKVTVLAVTTQEISLRNIYAKQ